MIVQKLQKLAFGVLGVIILISLGSLGYDTAKSAWQGEDPMDNINDQIGIESPDIEIRFDGADFNADVEVFAWRASSSDPYDSFIGKFTGGDTIENVYKNGKFSMVEVSEEYYSGAKGNYDDRIKQPPRSVDVSERVSYYRYNVQKVVNEGDLDIIAKDTLGQELNQPNSTENYQFDMAANMSKKVTLDLKQPSGRFYNPGVLLLRSLNDVEDVEVTRVKSNGNHIEFESSNIDSSENIEFNDTDLGQYDKMVTWDPQKMSQGDLLSVTIKVQTGNSPTEASIMENTDGFIAAFGDYDYVADIQGANYTWRETGFPENLTTPNTGEATVTVGVI